VVARAKGVFHVSQGSVETLFRQDGKRLYYFAANVFRNNVPCFDGVVRVFPGHRVYFFRFLIKPSFKHIHTIKLYRDTLVAVKFQIIFSLFVIVSH